jgi:hypothetical protein
MGCQHSVPEKRAVVGVGQTERMVSRAARVQVNPGNQSIIVPAGYLPNAKAAAKGGAPPRLDDVGHLLPEEVVRRTVSAIKNKDLTLGMPDNPIRVEVCIVSL